jgi:large subunit ribosomal protein LP1
MDLTSAQSSEYAVAWAAMILTDDKAPVTAENISKILTAANVKVEPYWPRIFANVLKDQDVTALLLASGGGGGGGGGGAADAAAAPAEEAKPESSSSSSSSAGGDFDLFD